MKLFRYRKPPVNTMLGVTKAKKRLKKQLGITAVERRIANRADEVLREVGAESSAWLSDTSPLGFDQRLSAFGQRLSDVVSLESATLEERGQDAEARLSVLRDAYRSVLEHDQRHREPRRIERVEMAMRLVRWLATGGDRAAPGSLGDAATDYLHDGGYVDWARLALRSGEEGRELSEAYGELLGPVAATQQRLAESFAGMLVDWSATETSDKRLMPVEQVLDRVVAPLASHGPLLAIVLDGMSVAVFRELMADIFASHSESADRIRAICDDDLVRQLAQGVTGKLGGKVVVAPRIFLKKLVADVLDRVDQHPDFDPRLHYTLTMNDAEMTAVERQAMAAAGVDDIELDL